MLHGYRTDESLGDRHQLTHFCLLTGKLRKASILNAKYCFDLALENIHVNSDVYLFN
jgi:hypothetical protein